jgi:hypothetical protein
MANDSKDKKNKGGGGKSSAEGLEVISVVIISFVIIFVVLLYAAGVKPSAVTGVDPNRAIVSFGAKIFRIWREYINPVFIVLDVVLLSVLIFAGIKAWPMRPQLSILYKNEKAKKVKKPTYSKVVTMWKRVGEKMKKGTPEAVRLAVVEADAVVDEFLKQAGYEGDHMADRLSQILPGELDSIEGVWRAHRLRNNLVHAPHIAVTRREADEAIKQFESFLKELGVL